MDYDQILERMQNKYTELTGLSPDSASDIGIRLRVLAGEVSALYAEMINLRDQAFAQTATGEALDLHAQTRAIKRKAAIPAEGVLRFTRETPASYDISLPAGILCSTRGEPQIYFVTTVDTVLTAGSLSADAPAAAVEPGEGGNAAPGKVCLMITSALGITAVTNLKAFSGGADREDDEALRARLLYSYANISNTTNRAFYYDMAMSHGDVVSANILPRKRGRGTVDVVIACHEGADASGAAAALAAKMAVEKEINVDVSVYPAVRNATNIHVQVAVASDVDFVLAQAACVSKIEAYLESLGVGKALLLGRLGRELFEVEGLSNYRIVTPASDITPAQEHVLRPGAITVERMSV